MINLKLPALVLTLAFCGCKGTEAPGESELASTPINATCPMMEGHDVDPEAEMADFNGHKIGFCCGGCMEKWEKKTDAEKQAFIDEAMKNK